MKRYTSRTVSLGSVFALLLVCQWGCSSQMREEQDSDEPGKGDVTEETSLSLLDGYNEVMQVGRQKCVEASDPNKLVYNVGSYDEKQTIQFISTKADLTRNFNLKMDKLEASVGPVGVGANFEVVNNYKKNDTSNYLLITLKKNYRVDMLDNRNLQLTNQAVNLLEGYKPITFLAKCGTRYITGAQYEAAFYLLIRISAKSLEKTNKVSAGLNAKGISYEPVTLSLGELSGMLENITSDTEISTQLYTSAKGFIVPTDLLKAFQKTFDTDTINALANIGEKMKVSIENDLCQDAGRDGVTCSDGIKAQGYFANVTKRIAQPSGFFFKDYSQLKNAPIFEDEMNPYVQISQKMDTVGKYLTAYQTLINKIESVYWEELLPVLETSTPFNYSLYTKDDNALSRITLDSVKEQARTWAEHFNPDEVNSYTAIKDNYNQCKLGANYGNYQPCMNAPTGEQAYAQAQKELNQYLQSNRIWVVNYAVAMSNIMTSGKSVSVAKTLTYSAAKNNCAQMSQSMGKAFRLPNLSEAKRLNLVVRHNSALPRKTEKYTYYNYYIFPNTDPRDWSNAIWFNDPSKCNKIGALRFMPNGDFDVVCQDNLGSLDLTPLCVLQNGLYLSPPIGF